MKILKLIDVLDLTGLSRSAVYELCAKGEFPSKVQLTARSVGWLEGEVHRWIQQQAAKRESI